MTLVIILLIIIAIGVLLMSELGQVFLAFLIRWGVILGVIALVLFILFLGYGWYAGWEKDTQDGFWGLLIILVIGLIYESFDKKRKERLGITDEEPINRTIRAHQSAKIWYAVLGIALAATVVGLITIAVVS